jgi:hypothetical protein
VASPEEAKWLTEEERTYVKARLRSDQGNNAAERKLVFSDVITVMKDHRIWLGGFMYLGMIVPAYSYAFFSPTIISTYHYSPIQTQLHSVPPWAASFVFSLILATVSDWTRHRATFAIAPLAITVSALAVLLTVHTNTMVEYAVLHLMTIGTYGVMPIVVCWFQMNLGGHHRRAIGSAWQIGFGNLYVSFLLPPASVRGASWNVHCLRPKEMETDTIVYLVAVSSQHISSSTPMLLTSLRDTPSVWASSS